MHDRYFYLADVLSVALAFWVRGGIWAAALIQAASALSDVAFLFRTEQAYAVSVDQRILATLMLIALVILVHRLAVHLGLPDMISRARVVEAPDLQSTADASAYPLDQTAAEGRMANA
jgi:hypothetical protein